MTVGDRVPALSYLRTDLSGPAQVPEQARMRRLSIRLGYELCEMIRVDASRVDRLVFLEDRIKLFGAEAIFVPTVEHLDGQLGRIVSQADVIEQNGETYARWSPVAMMLGDLLLGRLAEGSAEEWPGAASRADP